MTINSAAVETEKFVFGMRDCTVDSDVGKGDFLLMLGICTCVDTYTCDRTFLREWNVCSYLHVGDVNLLRYCM